MKSAITGLAAAAVAMTAVSETIRFDTDPVGAIPAGWTCGVTGRGNPKWDVQPDASLNPPTRVLLQSGSGAFPWCVRTGMSVADGFVEVKFRPVSGREDQAGGVVWRWKNGDNYYVARANALENNVSLYYAEGGSRKTLKYIHAPVPAGAWHTLRVEFAGTRIAVALDGKRYIQVDDKHIAGPGAVGVWTKADSVTAFDDFVYGVAR
jgi:FtsP/CotA-like multicopper oxidase with cupredoxin domain